MKVLHTADIHLKKYDDERWSALQKLIEIARKEKVQFFVISGDLFDKNFNAEELRGKIRRVFSNNGFKIIIISGNHDSNSFKSDFYFGDDVVILEDLSKPYEYEDIRIWGIPFEDTEGEKLFNKLYSFKNRLTDKKINILLYHGELVDASFSRKDFGEEGERRYMPVKLSYFNELDFDYVLAGHFHSKLDIRRLKNGGYFVYPGSPVSITRREIGRRKVNIFNIGESPKDYSLNTIYFEKVVIEVNPLENKSPIDIVLEKLSHISKEAKVILVLKGFINGEKLNTTEQILKNQLFEAVKNICDKEDFFYEVKDIKIILEDALFESFITKLNKSNWDEGEKKKMCDIAIRAFMKVKL